MIRRSFQPCRVYLITVDRVGMFPEQSEPRDDQSRLQDPKSTERPNESTGDVVLLCAAHLGYAPRVYQGNMRGTYTC